MDKKRLATAGWLAAGIVVALAALFLFFYPGPGQQAGLFTLYFSCNNNGVCNPGETYSDCPSDCCEADCSSTSDTVCHSACGGQAGCTSFITGCDGVAASTKICVNATTWAQCCNVVPPSPCSANQYCSSGECISCSTVCDSTCQSSTCYGVDPDCDVSGNPTTACCGNNIKQGTEVCDGTDLASQTCVSQGFTGGSLACLGNCTAFDTGSCYTCDTVCDNSCPGAGCFGTDPDCDAGGAATGECCGNNSQEGAEVCDGTDVGAEDCASQGFTGGSLACLGNCTAFDTGSCYTCDTVCDNSCPGAGCFGTDPDCDAGGAATGLCCGNTTCDAGEDAGNCAADCGCATGLIWCTGSCIDVCDSNTDCSDTILTTWDLCSNPGTCTAACSNPACTPVCSLDTDCDDANVMTADTCLNDGTCIASCDYSFACNVACDQNSDCDDGLNTTLDICSDPGTCDASCSNEVCTVACNADSECNDDDPATTDYCFYRGTCSARCVHSGCSIACYEDSECDDSNPLTSDACVDSGTCDAHCTNEACAIACTSSSDCDDSNPLTADNCKNPGECAASCENKAKQEQLSIEFPAGLSSGVSRGAMLDLNIHVVGEGGNPVENARVTVTDPAGNEESLRSLGSGYYFWDYNVPPGIGLGEQGYSFLAVSGDMVGAEELSLLVGQGSIKAILIRPEELAVPLNEKAEFRFKLVYESGEPVGNPDVNAMVNGNHMPLVFNESSGTYSGHYLFSEADPTLSFLVISAIDSFGNSGETKFEIALPRPIDFLLILIVLVLILAVLLAIFGLKRTHRLSKLLHRSASLSLSKKKNELQMAITQEKVQKARLSKRIKAQKAELKELEKDIEIERKRQAIAVKRAPTESKYAAHKTALAAYLLPGRVKRVFGPKKTEKQMMAEKRVQKIDSDIAELKERIQNLESEYCKQTIKEDFFRQKLFEYREKTHLLELEKKKLE